MWLLVDSYFRRTISVSNQRRHSGFVLTERKYSTPVPSGFTREGVFKSQKTEGGRRLSSRHYYNPKKGAVPVHSAVLCTLLFEAASSGENAPGAGKVRALRNENGLPAGDKPLRSPLV
jgi:hypothetical protein